MFVVKESIRCRSYLTKSAVVIQSLPTSRKRAVIKELNEKRKKLIIKEKIYEHLHFNFWRNHI